MTTKKSRYAIENLLSREDGVLKVGEARAVVLTESAFVFMQQVLHEQMPEFTTYGFYEMGYRAGLDMAAEARRVGGQNPEQAFRYFVEAYRQAGYGNIEVVEFDLAESRAVLRGRELIESAAAERSGIFRSPRAVDHYSRGMFAGLFSQLLGQEVVCEELKCEHRGDEACEFHILAYAAA